ncbi:glutamate--tRNA ligase [Bacteriovorax stolpii]|uniref:Glutamate--tRNA ligase n=1 Tax=Bacteriovorax stolpii TaxID=960 RepID=A0A2K9NQ18_BACTC|nr:glutamate--tRNA ligase [Bacteriovorax stolpii]AUN97611.1 glutamate--tRNA ligase [Bacteriovorax stolpii]TDP52793.1 glutamyl-tRNA synthetase/nondiscriminating glutamyl-tRNA synthetase [Bacteriovorax stolpii]
MTVRVRFAPSPTGYLHIGGARTAMYNYLFAKAMGGKYVLRIEDTDTERSERRYEEAQIEDLKWLDLQHHEGPDVGGDYGPYRQSERLHIYKEYTDKLLKEKKAYRCFCSEELLEEKKKIAEEKGLPPHYDGTCRHLSDAEVADKMAKGIPSVVRCITPKKAYTFTDKVRGEVTFPEDMVGDFVIVRANDIPVYNFAVVIDDMTMKISHVIRAEEHLNNTLRQLILYEAYNAAPPTFCHVSLLIGQDRQKLSKRHGATSVRLYQEQNYLPSAMLNYLLQLGWSHPEEKDIFDIHTLGTMFNLDRFTKSAAIYDIVKLNHINGEHLRLLPTEKLISEVERILPADHPFHKMDAEWKARCVTLSKEKMNFYSDIIPLLKLYFDCEVSTEADYVEARSWETTPQIQAYLKGEIEKAKASGKKFVTEAEYNEWSNHVKGELKIKGKQLFMGIRAVLTLQAHGSDLKFIVPLTPIEVLEKRINM